MARKRVKKSQPPYSPSKRGRMIGLAQFMRPSDVARQLDVAPSTVTRVLAKDKKYNTREDLPRSGRPLKLSERTLRLLRRWIVGNPRLTLKQTIGHLKQLDIEISTTTLRRYMAREGLQKFIMRRKPFLKPSQKAARVAYALQEQDRDWSDVVFCDEATIKVDGSVRRWVWRRKGDSMVPSYLAPRLRSSVQSVHVWAAVWGDGRTELVRLDCTNSTSARGGFNSALYASQILDGHLWTIKTAMEMDGRSPVVVHDGSPVHTGRLAAEVAADREYIFLSHPPNSPDLNVIENAWAVLKHELAVLPRRPTTTDALFSAAHTIWEDLKGDYITALVNSMPRRLQAVIEAQGGPIDY